MNTMDSLPLVADALKLKYNPKESFRPGQKAAVVSLWGAIKRGYKIIALDATTGSGKSIIAAIIGNLLGSSDILTTQIKLQDQYVSLGDEYKKVEGRGNFPCISAHGIKNADRGECLTGSDNFNCKFKPVPRGKYPVFDDKGWMFEELDKRCPYWRNVEAGVQANHTVFNYPYYVLKKNLPHCEFPNKVLQILDEGHNLESYIRAVNSFELHDLGLYHVRYIIGVDFKEEIEYEQVPMEKIKTVQNAIEWLDKLQDIVNRRLADTKLARLNGRDGLKRRYQMLDSLLSRIDITLHYYKKNPDNWVIATETDGFKLIPLYIGNYVYNSLLSHAKVAIIMSATLPRKEVLCQRLGLPLDKVFYYHMPSTFPPENAPIYSHPQPTMNYEPSGMINKRNKMGRSLGRVLESHEGVRGLILCNSFDEVKHYSQYLMSNYPEHSHRIIAHNRGDKTEYILDDHQGIRDGVIITPSMWEGEDFIDDKARFLSIAKVPYEDTKDAVVKGWMEVDKGRYFQNACQKLVQGIGRVVRSPEDHAHIHIHDGAFRRLYKYNRKEFPEEIQERVVYL